MLIEITDAEMRALEYEIADPAFLYTSQIQGRAKALADQIVALEVDRCRKNGIAIPSSDEAIVVQAYEAGTVKTAERRLADELATQPPIDAPAEPGTLKAISRKQFALAVCQDGVISFDEALAWATVGTLPKILAGVLDMIPDDQVRQEAIMHLAASTQFERSHPLTPFVAYLLSSDEKTYDSAALDELWARAATL
ncbi:hypothetical protein [Aureimonas sp. AU40]|uniref:hypothetical protein n=1 Tax=Aureimonas sp. AU40 TaxID=1637747 RepID=UPI000780346C|nr:hypothetical protein [Aureimonas sp. AU40]